MPRIEKILFTGRTHTSASPRESGSRTHLDRIDMKTSASGSGSSQEHTFTSVLPHPTAEQLFAAAWSACYRGAIEYAANEMKLKLPPDLAIEIVVDMGQAGNEYLIQAHFNLVVPGVAREVAEALANRGHEVCPYSKATHGNIEVVREVTV